MLRHQPRATSAVRFGPQLQPKLPSWLKNLKNPHGNSGITNLSSDG